MDKLGSQFRPGAIGGVSVIWRMPSGVLQETLLRYLWKSHRKPLWRRFGPTACKFVKKWLQHKWFPVYFVKFSRTAFFQNTSTWLVLYHSWSGAIHVFSNNICHIYSHIIDNRGIDSQKVIKICNKIITKCLFDALPWIILTHFSPMFHFYTP